MANLIHTDANRNAMANLIVDLIDVSGPGELEFQNSSDTELATITFANPAFGASSGGQANMLAGSVDEPSATAGTVDRFKIKDGAGLEVLQGDVTVPGGGGDITLTDVILETGDKVSLTSLTYTAAT